MGGEGGPKRKTATHPLPPIAEQGRGVGSPAAARFGQPGRRRRPGREGKGRGEGGAPIPLPSSGYGGARRRLHEGRRRRR